METYTNSMLDKDNWENIHVNNGHDSLCIQFTSHFMGSGDEDKRATRYYDRLYSTRKGYLRGIDFWEVPRWITEVNHIIPTDLLVVRDINEAKSFLSDCQYSRILFSVLDVTKSHVLSLIPFFDGEVILGGYVDHSCFDQFPKAHWFDSMKEFSEYLHIPYTFGTNYGLFKGFKVISRLCLSSGCEHKCAFCTIPKELICRSRDEIDSQINSFKSLYCELVYLDDKTFGQADNFVILPELYHQIRADHPEFMGFIIQTSASCFKTRLTDQFLINSHIQYVEIGVESFNDHILKALHKPATEALIIDCAKRLSDLGINFIPNIIIGIPEETKASYDHTIDFLTKANCSHMNIYTLAIYPESELGQQIGALDGNDLNENTVSKSFHKDKSVVEDFASRIYKLGMEKLEIGEYGI